MAVGRLISVRYISSIVYQLTILVWFLSPVRKKLVPTFRMISFVVVLTLAVLAEGKNDTNTCPELAVQTTYGGVLLWQLMVQGYYILDNVSGDVWELLKCREESLLDSASCFWAALETLRTTVATYRPYIADYKKQVYDYGVGIIGDWKCCVGSESCPDDNAKRTEPKFIDRNLFRSAKKSKETAAKDWPKPLPTIPPSPPTMPPQIKQTLGTVLIRAKLFGIDFMWFEIDLTNLFIYP